MKLAAGTRLGPYEIEHAIGAGGMGVVYRADDSRLGRKVAIKILPQAGGDQFRRFEREARTIGGLNHPNLLTLFDVGEHDGMPFLVTEMLDGESLRAHLSRGPMRIREAIQIAADVARGLAAAHDAGIVHRDVKPDNIFLTATGRTKILDFGIAKLRRSTMEVPVVDPAADTPTPTTRDTGVVIGTPGYMAPEQLDAGTVDERSDIFALGVVLYEMICGKRAFASDSPVEESYAILKTTPDPPKGATKSLARVVMRCLEKRKDARFQSAGDLAFALDELDASTDPISRISKLAFEADPNAAPTIRDRVPTVAPPPSRRGRWLAAAVLAAIACTLGGVLIGKRTAGTQGLLHASWPSVVAGGVAYRRVTYHTQSLWNARLAPDAKSVLYSAPRGGHTEIVRSAIGQPSIASTNVVGRLLDVSRRGELAVVTNELPGAGGTVSRAFEGAGLRPVADHVSEAAFLPDDTLAVVRGGLVIESPVGTPIVKHATGKLDHLRASPSGRLAFAEHPASGDLSGYVVVVDRGGKELLRSNRVDDISGLAWSPDGDEVWFTNGQAIYALGADAQVRLVVRDSLRLVVIDAQPGKVLVAPSDLRLKMFTGTTEGPFHEVGWFDSSDVESMSGDGSAVAFVEASGTGASDDGTEPCFIRRGDQPATLLGHGFRCVLLPDASAVVAITGTAKLERIPTSVGAATSIDLGKIAQLDVSARIAISWNGRYLVLRGAETGAGNRLWRIDLEHPGPVPIAATYVAGEYPITSDGDTVALARATGGVQLASVSGKPPHDIAGPTGETPLSFTSDGRALFVMHIDGDTIEVDRIELATDARTKWTRITPEQAPVYYQVALDADGGVVTYSTNSDASDLYVIEQPAAAP